MTILMQTYDLLSGLYLDLLGSKLIVTVKNKKNIRCSQKGAWLMW